MKDADILRSLATRYMERAADEKNSERRRRAYQTNALEQVRPLVWIDEVPWNEMNIGDELTLVCQSEEARRVEDWFRKKIFQWEHFQGDMILEP